MAVVLVGIGGRQRAPRGAGFRPGVLPGATGYLGIAFYNEETAQLDYGYVHVQAGAAAGFPATVLDYAYDRSGAAITIP